MDILQLRKNLLQKLLANVRTDCYCFHESSNPATTWNSLKNRIQHEIDKWQLWKNSFTKIVILQKDISIVMLIHVSYSFHWSSNPTTTWNSFLKNPCLLALIDKWHYEKITYAKFVTLCMDKSKVISIQVSSSFH